MKQALLRAAYVLNAAGAALVALALLAFDWRLAVGWAGLVLMGWAAGRFRVVAKAEDRQARLEELRAAGPGPRVMV